MIDLNELERASNTHCEWCNNTGFHLCPDVSQPITIKCSHRNLKELKAAREVIDTALDLKKKVRSASKNQPMVMGIITRFFEPLYEKIRKYDEVTK